MRSNTLTTSTLGLVAYLAAPTIAQQGSYFTLGTGMPVVLERVDPLLSAGKVSNHVHSVVGGNGFAPTMDFAQTQKSTCSTVRLKPDKSNYWMPALYYKSPHNSSFIRVPEQPNHKLYYKFGTGDNKPDLERSEFPQEFRMITGNAMLRSDDGSSGVGGNELNWQCMVATSLEALLPLVSLRGSPLAKMVWQLRFDFHPVGTAKISILQTRKLTWPFRLPQVVWLAALHRIIKSDFQKS